LYNVAKKDGVVSTAAPYQEQTCAVDTGRRPEVSDILSDILLNRDDENVLVVHAAEVALLNKKNQLNANNSEAEESDEEEDDTVMEYWSEEEAAPVEVDSDDE
jgi:uncharacterized protein (DUF2336 family)